MISTVDLKVSFHKLFCRKGNFIFFLLLVSGRKEFYHIVCVCVHYTHRIQMHTHTHTIHTNFTFAFCIENRIKLCQWQPITLESETQRHIPSKHPAALEYPKRCRCVSLQQILNIYLRLECARTDLLFSIFLNSPVSPLLSLALEIFYFFMWTRSFSRCFFGNPITDPTYSHTHGACRECIQCKWSSHHNHSRLFHRSGTSTQHNNAIEMRTGTKKEKWALCATHLILKS